MSGLADRLDDLYYFTLVAQYGGYSAASRVTGISKNKLSLRVAALERHLGIRLLQRTTRKVALTEMGQRLMEHGLAMLFEVNSAQEMITNRLSEPSGQVRITCPSLAARLVMPACITEFMARYPKINIQLMTTDKRFDPVTDRIDIAIRLRERKDIELGFVVKELGNSVRIFVATPEYLEKKGAPILLSDLSQHALFSLIDIDHEQSWEFTDDQGNTSILQANIRLACREWDIVRHALFSHQGIAILPDIICHTDLQSGQLIQVLPQWRSPPLIAHMVFPTRRGMLPAVRVLVDFFTERLPGLFAMNIGYENNKPK
ncbi:LysR substrate-binding domain-containing protein [Serratia liquefaciens]|uniref:LysR substrate-binding domain-containing protein n=1 Tax=Serratia liquefaciens TaxID=614 RepID=UPI00301C942D